MALSAQDFQKAFTVDAPIGDYVTKGIADVKAAREAREKKELEQQKFVYQEIDPLTVGTGTPDDPYIVSLVADAQQQIAKLPRNLTPGQHYARVMQILGPIKVRRQEAVMLKNQIEQQAAAQHYENPLVKPKVLAADAIRQAYFNPDKTPKTSLDFNQDHVASVLSSGDLKYYDMNLAQADAMKWSTEQAIGFAGRPSIKPYTTYTGTISPFFEIKESSQGATPEQIYQKTMKLKRDDGSYVDMAINPDMPKMLPESLYELSQSKDSYKLLTKRNFKELRSNPSYDNIPDDMLQRAAAYEAIRQATDLSVMKIQDEVNRPPARVGDGGGGGSTTSTPKPNNNWMLYALFATQGKASDMTTHVGNITSKTDIGQQTLANIFDNSNKNPKVIGSKGLQQNLQQARKSEEKIIDMSSQAPMKKMVIGKRDENDQFGNPKNIYGTAKLYIKNDGTSILKVKDEEGNIIKTYDFTNDPVAANDAWISDFGPYNNYNVYDASQDANTRPTSALNFIGRQTFKNK
jgi:hypothetical protein